MIFILRLLQILGILILVLPIAYTLTLVTGAAHMQWVSVVKDFLTVLFQAGLSASLSVVLGLLAALSLVSVGRQGRWLLYLGLMPQFLPSLLMIFAYVKVFSVMKVFPQSYWHVVALHILINIGLVSFLLHQPVQTAIAKKVHLFLSLKISKVKYLALLCRGELLVPILYCWILVFSYCVTSFSIPLVLSGEKTVVSFEQLIYQKGFVDGRWSEAALWGLLQIILVALLFKSRPALTGGKDKTSDTQVYKIQYPFYFFSIAASVILILALVSFPTATFASAWKNLSVDFKDMLSNTLLLAGWSFLFYALYFWSHVVLVWGKGPWVFYQKFWSLSPILLGIYTLALSTKLELTQSGRMIMTGLVLGSFIFPFAFKFWIWPQYNEIQKLKLKLTILSVPKHRAMDMVLVPYFYKAFFSSAGYVFLFVIGDFAISSILLSDTPTLGLSIKNHIFKYQLAEAQILSLGLMLVATLSLGFWGGRNVINSKL